MGEIIYGLAVQSPRDSNVARPVKDIRQVPRCILNLVPSPQKTSDDTNTGPFHIGA
jgi:hypothetical protein